MCRGSVTLCDIPSLASEIQVAARPSGIAKFVTGYVYSVLCILQSADI